MKDTFSKLHHNFSIGSSSASASDSEDHENSFERQRRKSMGLKMLMSRESSFGVVGFKSVDRATFKNMSDDSMANH